MKPYRFQAASKRHKCQWCPSTGVIIRQPELVARSVGGYHRSDPVVNMQATAGAAKGAREETRQHE